jgi:anti-sigma regulatory factor (Ser/Thr protein kinase)
VVSTAVEQKTECRANHAVHFYASDEEMAERVAGFLAEALDAGGTAVVVATPAHRAALRRRLTAGAPQRGELVMLDAAETLQALSVDGWPDRRRFDKKLGGILRAAARDGRPVAAFGEMVDLLWASGHVSAAADLERMWTELLGTVSADLLCACRYDIVAGADFDDLCRLHTGVSQGGPRAPTPTVARRDFGADVDAPRVARRFVVETLATWGAERIAADASLVASELATNAVQHASSRFSVELRAAADSVRLSVRDYSTVRPQRRAHLPGRPSGRGLRIVAALADAWGVETTSDGKVLWAEMRRSCDPPADG